VRFLAALLGATDDDLLLGAHASEASLAQAHLADYRIVDLATHGFIAGSKGLSEPALAVAPSPGGDGFVEASEILDWRLNADLVLLSACNTAASDGTPGAEGLSGLANSLFYAGARNLMVTHWSIPSGPAVDLVSDMITAYQDAPDRGYAYALRQAVIGMLDHPKSELYAHPVSWAGQFIVGAD
jgi:CHAT domain-containing protein